MNLRVAALLAWRSLRRHPTVAVSTVLGVAIGLTVVGAILIVDRNSIDTRIDGEIHDTLDHLGVQPLGAGVDMPARVRRILEVSFERGEATGDIEPLPPPPTTRFPTQEGGLSGGVQQSSPPVRRGEEDYQAMRLAVRLASLIAFAVGAVIVFYTMRFSVASRSREFALLLCLGEGRRGVVLSLLLEAAMLGTAGTVLGLLIAFPAAAWLIDAGISTTGRIPNLDFDVPWLELVIAGVLSVAVSLLGVAGPARIFNRTRVVDVLQPRFISPGVDARTLHISGFGWLLPPLMVAAWLAFRPFLLSWLSVVEFFILEGIFALLLAFAVLWWMAPVLLGAIRLAELLLRPWLPFHALLVGRRMRLTSRQLVFTVAGVVLVFSLLTGLRDITTALKAEIDRWAEVALEPYVFLEQTGRGGQRSKGFMPPGQHGGLQIFRLSRKIHGEFPMRLILAADANAYLAPLGRPEFGPGKVMVSKTLAQRFGLQADDRVVIRSTAAVHRFELTEVADDLGFFAEDGQYVDLQSYFLFTDGNPLFADNLELTLGELLTVRRRDGQPPTFDDARTLAPYYRAVRLGADMSRWQRNEIDRDFKIFDFILLMTLALAGVGVANNILIQVLARGREFAVLRNLGVSRPQTAVLLLAEGAVIGLVSGMLALVLGHVIGAISVAFLDRFTLFDYRFVLPADGGMSVLLLAVITCSVAALYPARVANRISSAESLHYE